ncbi:MAG: glycoside hydrolase family 3 protein, partial [Ktedonobacteraceae bacterium]|nr:glycoside hydrolase family 3 protein [Ktedonobacteraceae bacterium]
MLLATACSNPGGSAATPSPTSASVPVPSKSDATALMSEAVLRQQLTGVQQLIQGMSLEEKLGQLIVVEYVGKGYTADLQTMIAQQHVGGFMFQEVNHNFDAPYNIAANVKAVSNQAMKDAHIPLLIATDQEGGLVNRLYKFHGPLPSAEEMAASGTPTMAQQQGTQAAQWLLELGINADLAPVVDVQTVDPPVLSTRMFGRDPQSVSTYAGAYLDGLQRNGV